MPRLTVSLPDDRAERVQEMVDSGVVNSKSAAVNELISRGERLPEVERERDRLREQLAAVNSRADDMDALAEYVERERQLAREQRERQRAPLWRRVRWFVFGGGPE
jgi:Arc/MetJ-type ribon-helix-helix transcriptional regulator